jgi:hypothetical protein
LIIEGLQVSVDGVPAAGNGGRVIEGLQVSSDDIASIGLGSRIVESLQVSVDAGRGDRQHAADKYLNISDDDGARAHFHARRASLGLDITIHVDVIGVRSDQHLVHPPPVHIHHLQIQPFQARSGLQLEGMRPSMVITNAAQGLEMTFFLTGQAFQPENRGTPVPGHHPIDQPGTIRALEDIRVHLVFGLVDIPDDGFQDIGMGQQALDAAKLIDHKCNLRAGAFEALQHIEDRRSFRHEQRRTQHRTVIQLLPEQAWASRSTART